MSTFSYRDTKTGRTVASPRRLTASEVGVIAKAAEITDAHRRQLNATYRRELAKSRAATLAKAASKSAPMPAYDNKGNLIGLVDPDDLQAVDTSSGDDDKGSPAEFSESLTPGQIRPSAAKDIDDVAQQTADAVQPVGKALSRASFAPDFTPSKIAKSAGTVDARFARLLTSIDNDSAKDVQNAVGQLAMRMTLAGRVSNARAVRLAKSAALESAQHFAARTPGNEDSTRAAIAARLGGRR